MYSPPVDRPPEYNPLKGLSDKVVPHELFLVRFVTFSLLSFPSTYSCTLYLSYLGGAVLGLPLNSSIIWGCFSAQISSPIAWVPRLNTGFYVTPVE